MKDLGIYIHVPFCVRKCKYCDFYSVTCDSEKINAYTDAVCRNIADNADTSVNVSTVYFGGGTPSLLSPEQLGCILAEVKKSFSLSDDTEITLEANPHTVSAEKLKKLRETGINRLSIGVQSMLDDELKTLGRLHDAKCAEETVLAAADTGFSNISCDLMTALPGQSVENIRYSVEQLAKLPIQHISAYMLKIEEGTPFDCDEIRSAMPDEDTSAELYLAMVDILREKGFIQYEISNFAKKGFESRHNCRYWRCEDYLGIGPAAHSCFGGKRFAVKKDLDEFIASPKQPVYVTDEAPCGFEERAMLALRLTEGLDLREIGEKRSEIEKKIPNLLKSGYVSYNNEKLSLTPKGFLMSNSIIEYLIF